MSYSFAEVEEALASLYHIAPDRRSAFANRLKHFQRSGFPPGINTGRGKAASYHEQHVVLFALALELVSFGFTPEKAKVALEESETEIRYAIVFAIDLFGSGESILLTLQPDGLSDLKRQKVRLRNFGGPIRFLTGGFAARGIEKVTDIPAFGTRIAMFSLSGLLTTLMMTLDNPPERTDWAEFMGNLRAWASDGLAIDGPANSDDVREVATRLQSGDT